MTRSDYQVREAVKRFTLAHGYPPSYADLAREMSCTAEFVKSHIHNLLKEGLLESDHKGQSRAYRVPELTITVKEEGEKLNERALQSFGL